jgi:predicted nucleic acid-binding protein
MPQALAQVEAWLESPGLVLLGETPHHWTVLQSAIKAGHLAGPVVHDARIAALCIENGVSELLSPDRDFSRIPALSTRNPLIT